MTGVRISRPCYDKYRRCPGWAGGGTRWASRQRCANGSLVDAFDRRAWRWRINRCPVCGVWVLPYVVRYADWRYWGWVVDRWRRR